MTWFTDLKKRVIFFWVIAIIDILMTILYITFAKPIIISTLTIISIVTVFTIIMAIFTTKRQKNKDASKDMTKRLKILYDNRLIKINYTLYMIIFGIISVATAVILLLNKWSPISVILTIIITIFILNGIQDFKGVRIILSERLKEKNKLKANLKNK